MNDKRFELVDMIDRPGWFRLRCLRSFDSLGGRRVSESQMGGYVQSEAVMEQDDNSWVAESASVDKVSRLKGSFVDNCASVIRSTVVDTLIEKAYVTDSTATGAKILGGTVWASHIRDGAHIYYSTVRGCDISSGYVTDSGLDSAVIVNCDLRTASVFNSRLNSVSMKGSVIRDTEAHSLSLTSLNFGLRSWGINVSGFNTVSIGCQCGTFDNWRNHKLASSILHVNSSITEKPGEWERLQLLLNFLKAQHDAWVDEGKWKPYPSTK